MYHHAAKKKDALELNDKELLDTHTKMWAKIRHAGFQEKEKELIDNAVE